MRLVQLHSYRGAYAWHKNKSWTIQCYVLLEGSYISKWQWKPIARFWCSESNSDEAVYRNSNWILHIWGIGVIVIINLILRTTRRMIFSYYLKCLARVLLKQDQILLGFLGLASLLSNYLHLDLQHLFVLNQLHINDFQCDNWAWHGSNTW